MTIGFMIVCVVAVAVFVVRTSSRPTIVAADRSDVTNAALVAQGQRLYATRCASCHASDLEGELDWPQRRPNGVMPAAPLDESGQTWQWNDQLIFTIIKDGGQAAASPGSTSYMPAFGAGLTNADIWAIISYIKSTWPKQIRDAQPR